MRLFQLLAISVDSYRLCLAVGIAVLFALPSADSVAQHRSTLVDVDASEHDASARTAPHTLPRRAPVTDARLFEDMTIILPSDLRPASTSTGSTSTGSTARPSAAQAPPQLPFETDRPHTAPTGTDAPQESTNLFASATISAPGTEERGRERAPSEAYVPMLPQDFYAPTNVRRDPIAAEVGLPDMEPVGPSGDGFRYLQRRPLDVSQAVAGVVSPYPVTNVFSTYGDCRPGGRTHAGLDLGGVGPNGGIGTPVYAMARSQVTFIGRPEDDADKFGKPDTAGGNVQRGPRSMALPRRQEIPGYGLVHFFTRTYGSWRTGTIIVMQATEGPLEGHRIRYMHLGAVHPEIRVGDVVEAGQEVGLMGGTAVQHDMPHMHIDIEDANNRRVDVAPYIGLPGDDGRCNRR